MKDSVDAWNKLFPSLKKINKIMVDKGYALHIQRCDKLRSDYLKTLE